MAKHCSKKFTFNNLFIPRDNPRDGYYQFSHLAWAQKCLNNLSKVSHITRFPTPSSLTPIFVFLSTTIPYYLILLSFRKLCYSFPKRGKKKQLRNTGREFELLKFLRVVGFGVEGAEYLRNCAKALNLNL